jgi:hypothetical protein
MDDTPTLIPTSLQATLLSAESVTPTNKPSIQPLTDVYIILTLHNTQNRQLTSDESRKLKYMLIDFIHSHEFDNAKVVDVTVYNSELVLDHTKHSTEIPVVLHTARNSGSNTDYDELGVELLSVIEEYEDDMIHQLGVCFGYEYFRQVDGIGGRIVNDGYSTGLEEMEVAGESENVPGGSSSKVGEGESVLSDSSSKVGSEFLFY